MRPVLVDSLFEGLAVARRLSANEAALGGDTEAEPREPANVCQPGDVLGDVYRVERLIGKGGMGEVYEVEHLRLGARFAAKVLRAGSDPWPDAVRRFRREAAALAAMRSDHVVKVFDVSEPEAELPFYTMELLEGHDLRRLLAQEGALSVERAVRIVMGACLGVSAMHDAGLVHRDLKPANLFVTHHDNGEEYGKLLDFGVMKRENVLATTSPGGFVGTLRYVPPEQIENSSTVGKRADVYALAVILYEALTGRPPHTADTVERLIYSILNDTATSIGELNPGVPPALDELVRRAMARDPEARLPSVIELYDELAAYVEQPTSHGTATVRDRDLPSRSSVSSSRATPKRGLLLGLGLGTAVVVTGLLMRARSDELRKAEPAPLPAPSVAKPEPVPETAIPVLASPSSTASVAPSNAP